MRAAWTEQVLQPGFLAGLDRLSLAWRRAGREETCTSSGGTLRTSGLEWAGQRPYQPGDDPRYLDWYLLARTDRPFVRRFIANRANRIDILIDRSRSMTVGRPPKSDLACALGFVMGYIALSNGVRVSAMTYADRLLPGLPAGRGPSHQARLLDYLADLRFEGTTRLAACLNAFTVQATEIGQVLVISDLLDERVEAALHALRARGFEVFVLRLRADDDEDPGSASEALEVIDVETGKRRRVWLDSENARIYRRERQQELEHLSGFCAQSGITFVNVDTWRDLSELVFREIPRAGMLN
jgi:uncharacterized protein (DUF58 family)